WQAFFEDSLSRSTCVSLFVFYAAPNAATPLIRDREAEEQRTGLLTGSNSGSSTTSYNPLEMSDCSPNYKPLP
ncbi:hypothetical protein GBAR_LOCUS31608, partial [Geodia barretti]